MDLQEFSKQYLQNVKIPIANKQESIEVQKIFLQCGYIWFNGYDKIACLIDSAGIDSICSYPKKTISWEKPNCLQEKRLVSFNEFIDTWANTNKNVVICLNCKNIWIAPINECTCKSKTFHKTHPDNLMLSKNLVCL